MQIKGKSIIELKNVNTGKTEKIKSENIVTNHLAHLCEWLPSFWPYATFNTNILPLYNKALGGIYLFDNNIEEDADNYLMPGVSQALLTGYGGNSTTDGNDTKRGSRNVLESTILDNGYKYVWDFATNEANGIIKCLALTHEQAGYNGYNFNHGITAKMHNTDTGAWPTYFVSHEKDDNLIVTVAKTSTTNIEIIKHRPNDDFIKLNNKLFALERIKIENINITDTMLTTLNILWIDGGDGFYYGVNGSSTTLYICSIDKSALTYKPAAKYTIEASITNLEYSANPFHRKAVIRDGYIYTFKNNRTAIVKINLNNPADIKELNCNPSTHMHSEDYAFIALLPNKDIAVNGYLIGRDDTIANACSYKYGLYTENSLNSSYYYPNMIALSKYLYTRTYGYNWVLPNLTNLGTINNLSSPVIKTADKTMKITYILSYE